MPRASGSPSPDARGRRGNGGEGARRIPAAAREGWGGDHCLPLGGVRRTRAAGRGDARSRQAQGAVGDTAAPPRHRSPPRPPARGASLRAAGAWGAGYPGLSGPRAARRKPLTHLGRQQAPPALHGEGDPPGPPRERWGPARPRRRQPGSLAASAAKAAAAPGSSAPCPAPAAAHGTAAPPGRRRGAAAPPPRASGSAPAPPQRAPGPHRHPQSGETAGAAARSDPTGTRRAPAATHTHRGEGRHRHPQPPPSAAGAPRPRDPPPGTGCVVCGVTTPPNLVRRTRGWEPNVCYFSISC